MTGLAEPRFEHGRAMLLGGIRRHHRFATVGPGIAAQWRDFEKLGSLPGQVGTVAYGAICGAEPQAQRMEYMCAYEVGAFDGLPSELGRMRVPAAYYAVFRHDGDVAGVQGSWQYIFSTWLPRSGFESGQTPDFERYDERFDTATGRGSVELWVPIKPR
jgi:predicted transcriptional regulator YdeE